MTKGLTKSFLSSPVRDRQEKTKMQKRYLFFHFSPTAKLRHRQRNATHVQVSEKSGTNGNFIYYLHYMLYMFTPILCAFSQPPYRVSPLRCVLWIPFRMSGIKLIRHLPLGPSLTTTKKHYLHPFIQC
jgi:hypothetical protein